MAGTATRLPADCRCSSMSRLSGCEALMRATRAIASKWVTCSPACLYAPRSTAE